MKLFKPGRLIGLYIITILISISCTQKSTLKDAYKNSMYIGAAIDSVQIEGRDPKSIEILLQHFSSVTAEDDMKWENIHPAPGVYNFAKADSFIAFGQRHNMFIIGHCLLWHQQTPLWVFTDSLGNNVSRDTLLQRLQDHISTIVTRYKGKVNGYDVVNEALNEDGTMRKSKWYEIIGEDYIQKAFEYAQAADPNVELYYNDYNIEVPAKRAGAIKIIKDLQAKNIKVDGVGIQGHWHLDAPELADIENSIKEFGQLGLGVHITEMDINVLPRPENLSGAEITTNFALTEEMNPYPNGLPDSMQQVLTNRYVDMFKIFNKYPQIVKRITFWGITDNMSWLNDWPIKGRTNYPLLFNRDYMAKPVVEALVELKK